MFYGCCNAIDEQKKKSIVFFLLHVLVPQTLVSIPHLRAHPRPSQQQQQQNSLLAHLYFGCLVSHAIFHRPDVVRTSNLRESRSHCQFSLT